MNARPDFSPAMLALFLRARAMHAASGRRGRCARETASKSACSALRSRAGVTHAQFDLAWMGWLPTPETRARLWAVLGHHPADFGIVLTHGGQEGSQPAADRAPRGIARPVRSEPRSGNSVRTFE